MANMKKMCSIIIAIVIVFTMAGSVMALTDKPNKTLSEKTLIVPIVECPFDMYVADIQSKNMLISETKLKDVASTITFREYLSFTDLENYVGKHSISIVNLEARGLDEDGERVTIFTRTDKGLDETHRILLLMAEESGFDFIGITGIYATVDATSIASIRDDDRTYLVDTSADMYFQSEKAINGSVRNSTTNTETKLMFPKSLAWELEDLGYIEQQ
jgi:hypothetical protein